MMVEMHLFNISAYLLLNALMHHFSSGSGGLFSVTFHTLITTAKRICYLWSVLLISLKEFPFCRKASAEECWWVSSHEVLSASFFFFCGNEDGALTQPVC